jgi:ketosteroid isomerase-like protein
MKYLVLLFVSQLFFGSGSVGQVKTDKVGKLVAAENFFAAAAKEKAIKAAFLSVLDDQSIVFRGGPVNAVEFYKKQPETSAKLYWEPVYARIAKSDDFGFTTGPSTYKRSDTSAVSYGDYLSVWKKNKRGVWKLAVDIGVSHPKPTAQPALKFLNPQGERFFRQLSDKRLGQREDIILSSDKLYATILKADNQIARNEFLNDDTRLLFPGAQPVTGKEQVRAFWEKQQVKITSAPINGERAYSGDLAYTYGNATIEARGKSVDYNYLRIWEIQPGFKWNVIAEVYVEARGL